MRYIRMVNYYYYYYYYHLQVNRNKQVTKFTQPWFSKGAESTNKRDFNKRDTWNLALCYQAPYTLRSAKAFTQHTIVNLSQRFQGCLSNTNRQHRNSRWHCPLRKWCLTFSRMSLVFTLMLKLGSTQKFHLER